MNTRFEDCWYKDVCTTNINCNDCIRYTEMKYLMQESNLPENKCKPMPLYPEECDKEAFEYLANIKSAILRFVSGGGNLLIASSNPGNGKTTWAIKLMLKYFDEIWAGNGLRCRGLFISVPWLLTKQKEFNVQDSNFDNIKRKILSPNTDIVIWDDIASTTMSGYDYSQLFTLIDQRMLADKTNIFTSNKLPDELSACVGSKLHSRISHNSINIILRGKDYRYGNFTDIV